MATFTGRFLQLAKTTTEWNAADPVLMNGELGVADSGSSAPILKVGDGVRPWTALPQISGSGGGAANDYIVGTTTTLAPGSFASVTIDNLVDPPTISFGIPRGNTGPANELSIGTTTTGDPGTPASATITGTPPAQVLNLIIPQGDVGPPGADGAPGSSGPTGATGPANNLTIGTVTTGAPGSPADATITGTPPAQELNLTIPAGLDGAGLLLVDPTGTIGLTMVPGVATTTTRSDSSPPLSQAIVPTWTGQHTFARNRAGAGEYAWQVSATNPTVGFLDSDGGANEQRSIIQATSTLWRVAFLSDDELTVRTVIAGTRSGNALTALDLGNATDNPAFNFLGTGVTSVAGQIVVGAPTGGATGTGTINATGFYINGVALAAATAGNPSALVGLSAINGAAVTFMRSDAAPALNVGISPTWTGSHTFSNAVQVNGDHIAIAQTDNYIESRETDGATDAKVWWLRFVGGNFHVQTRADSLAAGSDALVFTRAGTAITQLVFGNATDNPTFSFTGTGTATFGGQVAAGTKVSIATDAPLITGGNVWSPAANLAVGTVGANSTALYTNSLSRLSINSSGTVTVNTPTSGVAFRVANGFANSFAASVTGSNTSGQSYGLLVSGGTTSADEALRVTTQNGSTMLLRIFGDGGLQMGTATGGDMGAGTINATGFYINGVAVGGGGGTFADGTVGAPSITFTADLDTGFYRRGSGDVALALNGVLGVVFSATQNAFALAPVFVIDGTVGAPGLAFNNDVDTGFYRAGTNTMVAVVGGAESMIFSPSLVYVTQTTLFQTGDGTSSTPGLAFSSDPDTGMYRAGANVAAFAAGGVPGPYITGISGGTHAGLFSRDGTAAGPALTFDNDPDTGIYRGGTDRLDVATAGASHLAINDAAGVPAIDVQKGVFRVPNGAAGTPSLAFSGDPDTGMYWSTTNTIGFSAGGTLRLSVSTSAITSTLNVSAPTFTTTSARGVKRVTGAPAHASGILSRLRPILYRLLAGDDHEQLGLIAEEVHEVCPQLSDGKTVAYAPPRHPIAGSVAGRSRGGGLKWRPVTLSPAVPISMHLFQPRISTAIANVNFRSNGGVDLAQRFETRNDSQPIANTSYRAGASDLAALFLGLGVTTDPILSSGNFTAGTNGAGLIGYRNPASGYTAFPGQAISFTPEWTKGGQTYRLDEILLNEISGFFMFIRISHATVTPPNTDAVYQFMRCTGIFANSGGVSVTRNFARSTYGVTNTHTTPSGRPGRSWQTGRPTFSFRLGQHLHVARNRLTNGEMTMQNGHAGTGAQPISINPVQAAQFALMFLQRAEFKAGERDAYACAEGLLNAIVSGQAVLAPPAPARTADAPAIDPTAPQ